MVFQSFNLFSHLTILRNVTLAPMRVSKMSKRAAPKPRRWPCSNGSG
jgi:ABC-type polar amino acid transport system ATPase subunit